MGEIRYDCPHEGCRTKNASFSMLASVNIATGTQQIFAVCTQCGNAVILNASRKTTGSGSIKLHEYSGVQFNGLATINSITPPPPTLEVVESLPAPVKSAFTQAEQSFAAGSFTLAAVGYRLAIERALKVDTGSKRRSLYDHIEAANVTLPKALIDLLHQVRFLGGDAAHEIEDPDPDDVATGRDFARLYFVYTVELPERVAAALAKRGAPPPL